MQLPAIQLSLRIIHTATEIKMFKTAYKAGSGFNVEYDKSTDGGANFDAVQIDGNTYRATNEEATADMLALIASYN